MMKTRKGGFSHPPVPPRKRKEILYRGLFNMDWKSKIAMGMCYGEF